MQRLKPVFDSSKTISTIASGTLIDGRYMIDREIGRGAMGIVYLARDTGLDRLVAIKTIDPALVRDQDLIALFRHEATAVARVRSENVIQIYSFGTHQSMPFFAMEYVDGVNLDRMIAACRKSGAPTPIHRAATIIEHCASGLGAVHGLGLVHRDVKPSNILVESGTGRPVLIDFGLASPRGVSQSGLGTPAYMAPELWGEPQKATPASDVYALGATTFELLTGAPPYEASNMHGMMCMHVTAPIPQASKKRPAVAAIDEVISRALAKEPEARYPNATAFQRALEKAARIALPDDAPFGPPVPSGAGVYAIDALVIDDDETFRTFAERAIHIAAGDRSLRVRTAASGLEALNAVEDGMPDLVLLDFDMPGLNGLETLSYLRALPGGSRARVMVITGSVEKIARCQFDLLGVNEFVSKPVPIRDLARRLDTMIGTSWGSQIARSAHSDPSV